LGDRITSLRIIQTFFPKSWSSPLLLQILIHFFFSSRRRHTRFDCDWSSDVCSSDLFDWLPKGLEYHVAFKSNGNFRVSEIWDSREQFDAFGERLMPLLKDVGIELAGEPEMLEIHNIIKR